MASATSKPSDYVEWMNLAYTANPASLTQEGGYTPVPPQSALTFHDKHLDQGLVLRHVRSLTALVVDLSNVATELVQGISSLGVSLPKVGRYFVIEPVDHPRMRDAMAVGEHYVEHVSEPCCSLASTLAFHPACPAWTSILCWNYPPSPRSIRFAVDGYSLRVCRTEDAPYELILPRKVQEFIDDETKDELRRLIIASPYLITGQMYAVAEEAQDLVKRLLQPSSSGFKWIMPRTLGQELYSFSVSDKTLLDADILPSVKEEVRKSRLHKVKQARRLPKASSTVIPPSRAGIRRGRSYDTHPDSQQFLQHAWAQSVAQNTTFILFHCGNYDRIGVRHRETQTLYLSDLIDVKHCKDPAYGKLQVGLYSAAMQDAKERLTHVKESLELTEVKSVGKKRRLPDDMKQSTNRGNKRRRVNANQPEKEGNESDDLFREEISRRDLALVRLQYGIYNSLVPASFLRCGPSVFWGEIAVPFKEPKRKASYSSTDYMSLTLGDEIDEGAVGTVHRGTLSLQTNHGAFLVRQVVAKLAFQSEHKESLEDEMSMYVNLSRTQNVRGVLPVYGLFKDMEGGPLLMILPFGGVSLFIRETERHGGIYPNSVTVSESERKGFIDALQSIHDGGILHGDIRPQNMLVNGEDVYLIDFDRARDQASTKAREDEMVNLRRLLAVNPAASDCL